MKKFSDTFYGSSNPSMVREPNPDGTPQMQTTPANPRQAIMDAMASTHPGMREMGAKAWAEEQKGRITPKDLATLGNPRDVLANPNDPSKWGAKSNLGEVDGMVYDKDSKQIVKLGGEQPTFPTMDGDRYMQSPSTGARKKLDNSAKVNVTNIVDKAGNKFATELAGKRADMIAKSYEGARGLPQTLDTLNEASANLSSGIKSGQLADIQLTMAKLAKSFGLGEVAPEIANTETYRAHMANSVLEVLKTLRPASDKDVEYAEKAAGGSIKLDDKTMLRLINSARIAGLNKLADHDTLLTANQGATGALPEDLATFKIPFSVTGDDLEYKNGRFTSKAAVGGSAAPASAANPSWLPPGFKILSVQEK
jgi:hypothetical protein